MLLFSRKRYSVLIFGGCFLVGALLCGCFFAANTMMPTIQFGIALIAAAVELRRAHRSPVAAAKKASAEVPPKAASASSAKERKQKKSR